MSLAIAEIVIGAENDQRAGLASELIVRQPTPLQSSWDTCWVIALLNTSGATNNIPATYVSLGLGNSTNAQVGDRLPHHCWALQNSATATYNAGTTCPYYTISGNWYCNRYINSTTPTLISFNNLTTQRVLSGDGEVARTILGLHLNKTNTSNVTAGFFYRSATTDPTDVDLDDILAYLDSATVPSGYTVSADTSTGGPHSIDEGTNGVLDSVFVNFIPSAVKMWVSSLVVATA